VQRLGRETRGHGSGGAACDLRMMLDEVGICTWSLDPATGRVAVSGNCHAVLGVPARCLTDPDAFQTVVHPEDRAALAEAVRGALADGGRRSLAYRVRQADGGIRWLRAHGWAEGGRGARRARLRGIVYRIDGRSRPRPRPRARPRALQPDLVHAARLSALGEMASALAHELNQPLGAISNYLAACEHLLVEPGSGRIAAARDALAGAIAQAQRAGTIIRRMRDLAVRGEADRRLESVAGLIAEACDLALVGTREQGIGTRIDAGPPGIRVLADRVQIQQVLVNLIRNACEAMRAQARRELTIVAAAGDAGLIRISVSDTGPGIAESVAATLFLPFVTSKPTGMGVGLSVSRSIVHAHGGALWADSPAAGGTTFHFTLPTVEE
jgi:signal transduction histidine kinase